MCAIREAYGEGQSEVRQGQLFQRASLCLERAVELVKEDVSVYESLSESAETVKSNLRKFRQWRENGGSFEGAIMW